MAAARAASYSGRAAPPPHRDAMMHPRADAPAALLCFAPFQFDEIAQRISVLSSHKVVQRLPKLLLAWSQDHRTILYILVALVVGFVIGRSRTSRASRGFGAFGVFRAV